MSIRDAVKLLAKPRPSKAEALPTIDAEFSEVEIEPAAPSDPVSVLADQLEAEFLRIPFKEREVAVEQVIERLSAFRDRHCAKTTTLAQMRQAFPGVGYRDLREQVSGFIRQWQYACIQHNDHGQECIRTEWAEEFVEAQKANGWKEGEPLRPWPDLLMKPSSPKTPTLPRL